MEVENIGGFLDLDFSGVGEFFLPVTEYIRDHDVMLRTVHIYARFAERETPFWQLFGFEWKEAFLELITTKTNTGYNIALRAENEAQIEKDIQNIPILEQHRKTASALKMTDAFVSSLEKVMTVFMVEQSYLHFIDIVKQHPSFFPPLYELRIFVQLSKPKNPGKTYELSYISPEKGWHFSHDTPLPSDQIC